MDFPIEIMCLDQMHQISFFMCAFAMLPRPASFGEALCDALPVHPCFHKKTLALVQERENKNISSINLDNIFTNG